MYYGVDRQEISVDGSSPLPSDCRKGIGTDPRPWEIDIGSHDCACGCGNQLKEKEEGE